MTNMCHSRGEIRGFSIGHSTPAFSTKPNTTVFHIKAIFHHFVKNIFAIVKMMMKMMMVMIMVLELLMMVLTVMVVAHHWWG